MKKQQHHIEHPLHQEILQAYLQGTLSKPERQQVEDIIAAHPYYKEVLEGLRWVDEDYPLSKRLAALSANVNAASRTSSSPKIMAINSPWWRWAAAAASVALLVVVALWAMDSSTPDKDPIAQTLQTTKSIPSPDIHASTTAGTAETLSTPPPPSAAAPPEKIAVPAEEAKEEMTASIEVMEDEAPPPVKVSEPVHNGHAALPEDSFGEAPRQAKAGNKVTAAPDEQLAMSYTWDMMLKNGQQEKVVRQAAEKPVTTLSAAEAWWAGKAWWLMGDSAKAFQYWQHSVQKNTAPYSDSAHTALQKYRQ